MSESCRCIRCGAIWEGDSPRAFPTLCSSECADAWMDAHPADKAKYAWITRSEAVDSLLKRAGLLPVQRATPPMGGN